jgi:hypothetical protein
LLTPTSYAAYTHIDDDTTALSGELTMSTPTQEKIKRPKVTLIPAKGVSQTINYLLEDRNELEWLVAIGRNKKGEIFFYDTGGDIIEDLGTLDYLKQRLVRAHFGDEWE